MIARKGSVIRPTAPDLSRGNAIIVLAHPTAQTETHGFAERPGRLERISNGCPVQYPERQRRETQPVAHAPGTVPDAQFALSFVTAAARPASLSLTNLSNLEAKL